MNSLKTPIRTLSASQTSPCDAGASVPPALQVHVPVLYNEILNALCPRSPGRYVDATLGAGGHARGILAACAPNGELLGFEVDPDALNIARKNLQEFGQRVHISQTSYIFLQAELRKVHWENVDGIIADFGVSSLQLDQPEKGFSFLRDGPLDMRFDSSQKLTAADLVNNLKERELADLIKNFGEEPQCKRIAHAIVSSRPFHSSKELASTIKTSVHHEHGRTHPATRTFQALRIAVNDELGAIQKFLPQALYSLKKGGKLAVISFHSLEDRIVKQFFHRESRNCICPPEQLICNCDHEASLREVSRHPVRVSEVEIINNPRARSARLRIAEKI